MSRKYNILGILVDGTDYDDAAAQVIQAAHAGKAFAVSALAVHGVMTGVNDPAHKYRLNNFDLVTPDGQPVRWAMNLLWKAGLRDRVKGPALTLKICELAAREGLPVYFYGSRPDVLHLLEDNLRKMFPDLKIAGMEASKFRQLCPQEKDEVVRRIRMSGARLCFVGLGCPRQEVFVYEFREAMSMPLLAVGAAFDYHAGLLTEPPEFVQRMGLHWLCRLLEEPRRLMKRYTVTNTGYLFRFICQALRLWKPDPLKSEPPAHELLYG